MKKIVIAIISGILFICLCTILVIYIRIDNDVKKNIETARKGYPGTAEEALISFLMDETNSCYDRTHKAIWTLGQIKSEKALPVLKGLYNYDPEGNTCFGNHDSMLCQYEIHKAISAIEKRFMLTHAHLNK